MNGHVDGRTWADLMRLIEGLKVRNDGPPPGVLPGVNRVPLDGVSSILGVSEDENNCLALIFLAPAPSGVTRLMAPVGVALMAFVLSNVNKSIVGNLLSHKVFFSNVR